MFSDGQGLYISFQCYFPFVCDHLRWHRTSPFTKAKEWITRPGHLKTAYNVAVFTVASASIYLFGDMLAL